MTPRAEAARILALVIGHGRSLSVALTERAAPDKTLRDRALVRELCYGVLRWYPRLAALAGQLLERGLKRRDLDVHCLILIGLYQLLYTRVPPHAAVAETVEGTRALGKPWTKGLVNAVLRRFQRDASDLCAVVDREIAAATAHPSWLLELIRSQWPTDWEMVVAANNTHPPMTLRVNRARISRADYHEELARAGLDARSVRYAPCALQLAQPLDAVRLPGFDAGMVSVQDAAAQLAVELLALAPGQRILDACAAPGGKTAHILETLASMGDATPDVTAIDIEPARLARVQDNLNRLHLDAAVVIGDAVAPQTWWNGAAYDRILLDAPCSATGVIRRHPDIKLLRRASDIEQLAARQRQLLAALWPLLRPGGMLLYVTCSILRQENQAVIAAHCRDTPRARVLPIDAAWGRAAGAGRQILPGENGMDGFYYARLEKQ